VAAVGRCPGSPEPVYPGSSVYGDSRLGGGTERPQLIAQREEQIAARDQEKTRAEGILNLPENRSTRDRSQFLNELFRRKAFSWTRVFEDLERVMPARLHLISIQPATAPTITGVQTGGCGGIAGSST